MATPTTSLSLLSRPSRPPPVLRRRRNFQPAAALVNQSTRQPGSHGSPSTPLLAALSPAPLTAATSCFAAHPEPAKLTGDKRSARSLTPGPNHVPTAPLTSLNHFAGCHTRSLARSETRTRKPQIRATQVSRADFGGRGRRRRRRRARAGPAGIAHCHYRPEAAGSCSL